MATDPTQFIENATVPAAAGVIASHAVPGGYTDKLYEIILCNTHNSAVTVSLWFVPSGGARSAANKIVDAQTMSLAAGETKWLSFEQRLKAGTAIHGEASTDAVVSIHAAGDRVNG
jgi:hypothetical protein